MLIYEKLKAIRMLLGLSQSEASALSGIQQKDISLLEKGNKKFIPNEYILFLYKQGVDINSLFDDNREIEVYSTNTTPIKSYDTPTLSDELSIVSEPEIAFNVPPTLGKTVPPTVPPTHNFGAPKVITVNENQDDVISLVPFKAAAGYLNGYADPEYIEELPTIRMPGLKGGLHRAFEIKGHSMAPTLHNSSIAVGRWVETLEDIRDRRIYIIVTKTDGIVAKRVLNRIADTGKLILLSDNQNKRDYPNIILDPSDVTELWYLRGSFIFEFPEPGELHQRFNDLEAKVTVLMEQMRHLQR
ncbi:hypothetical protein FW774_17155 [Pedobacter sp. BS3]|uniref:LexA family transcriptional regulator n=1 Tax=Pedobacter sp. BS3 TaxID=2567937 RepID=UPI0011EE3C2C|nr:LexA family transcriptional regulator [Pedobacter sp. BS3]TZF81784.1 hypothetical protein FW774_17155 [Pedobacter sp. BS3]